MYCTREDLVSRRVDITNQTSPTHNRSPEPVNNYDDQQEDFDLYLFSGGRSPAYLLEHLATFTVSPENDLVYPADGMRRLLAMEKTSGIWTQKVFAFVLSGIVLIPNCADVDETGQKNGEYNGP